MSCFKLEFTYLQYLKSFPIDKLTIHLKALSFRVDKTLGSHKVAKK